MSDRAAFRAFVRANHPDVGGDPPEFAAGLARFRRPDARHDAPVTFVAHRRSSRARRRGAVVSRVALFARRGVVAVLPRFRRRPSRVR
ncbi:hypothetical protein [Amycolatopsis sp. NPDC003731]